MLELGVGVLGGHRGKACTVYRGFVIERQRCESQHSHNVYISVICLCFDCVLRASDVVLVLYLGAGQDSECHEVSQAEAS